MLERVLVALLAGGHVLLEGVPGLAKTLTVQDARRGRSAAAFADPVHARPGALRPDRHAHLSRRQRHVRRSSSARCSATCCWPTRSTARRPRCSRRCWRSCRSGQVTIGGETHPRAEPVPGARHPEPDRVRGHLPAARGPGRPVPDEGRGRLPDADRGGGGRRARDRPAGRGRAACSTMESLLRFRGRRGARSTSTARSSAYAVELADATRRPDRYGLDDLEHLVEYGAARAVRSAWSSPRRRWRCCAAAATCSTSDVRDLAPDVSATASCSPTTRCSRRRRRRRRPGPRAGRVEPGVEAEPPEEYGEASSRSTRPPGSQGPGPMPGRWCAALELALARRASSAAARRPPCPRRRRGHRARPAAALPAGRRRPPARRRGQRPHGPAARAPAGARARADHVDRARLLARRWRSARPTG